VLEKELSRCMWANQELNQRLSNMNLHPGQTKGERKPGLELCCSYQGKRKGVYVPLRGGESLERSQEQHGCESLALSKCSTGTDFDGKSSDPDTHLTVPPPNLPQQGWREAFTGLGTELPLCWGPVSSPALGNSPCPWPLQKKALGSGTRAGTWCTLLCRRRGGVHPCPATTPGTCGRGTPSTR